MANRNLKVERTTHTKVGVETPLSYVSCYKMGKKVEIEGSTTIGGHTHYVALYLSLGGCQALYEALGRKIEEMMTAQQS